LSADIDELLLVLNHSCACRCCLGELGHQALAGFLPGIPDPGSTLLLLGHIVELAQFHLLGGIVLLSQVLSQSIQKSKAQGTSTHTFSIELNLSSRQLAHDLF
jgi:hypothetical protein